MNQCLHLSTAALLLAASPTLAAEDAKDILERALKGQGGAEALRRADALIKFKGTVFSGANGKVSFTGEMAVRPGERDKLVLSFRGSDAELEFALTTVNGQSERHCLKGVEEVTPSDYISAARFTHDQRLLLLAPLLREPPAAWTADGESKVGGRPTLRVRLKTAHKPRLIYDFDRETGAVSRVTFSFVPKDQAPAFREPLTEVLYEDHGEVALAAAERTLKAAGVSPETPALLAFLRQPPPGAAQQERIKTLIDKLGHDDFKVRDQASKGLMAEGPAALPALEAALRASDPEVARRAGDALNVIKTRYGDETVRAAVRVLASRRPPEARAVLEKYLPSASEEVAAEVRQALAFLDKKQSVGPNDKGRLLAPGFKLPTKITLSKDGVKTAEVEIVDVQFYHRLDDKYFAKP